MKKSTLQIAFMLSIVRFTMIVSSSISSSFTAFKQFCVLYFTIAIEIKNIMETIAIEIKDMETIAIEIKDIMEADNYHTANTKRGSASNKNHQFCVG
jgi:energy-coupling factor transporter transmembrane protein EcfT